MKDHGSLRYSTDESEIIVGSFGIDRLAYRIFAKHRFRGSGGLISHSELHPIAALLGLCLFGEDKLVTHSHHMSGADLSRVLRIVLEILLIEDPVLVTDKAVAVDIILIEGELELHILRDRIESSEQVGAEDLLRLALAVDIVVNAVSVVGDGFHIAVTVVSGPEAENRDIHALALLFGHEILKLLRR